MSRSCQCVNCTGRAKFGGQIWPSPDRTCPTSVNFCSTSGPNCPIPGRVGQSRLMLPQMSPGSGQVWSTSGQLWSIMGRIRPNSADVAQLWPNWGQCLSTRVEQRWNRLGHIWANSTTFGQSRRGIGKFWFEVNSLGPLSAKSAQCDRSRPRLTRSLRFPFDQTEVEHGAEMSLTGALGGANTGRTTAPTQGAAPTEIATGGQTWQHARPCFVAERPCNARTCNHGSRTPAQDERRKLSLS